MRTVTKLGWLSALVAGFVVLFHARAQTPPGGKQVVPATRVVPAATAIPKARDGAGLPEAAQPIFFSGSRAKEWLKLTIKPDLRFVYGFQPALRTQIDGDNFTSQAGAVFALARASRYYRDQRGATNASEVALALKLETMEDPAKTLRYTVVPAAAVNRLSALGMFVSAVHELGSPEEYKDLLNCADQMCNYLRQQQRPDGSLLVSDGANLLKSGSADIDAEHAGRALQGIIRSQKHRPADWKLDVLRKARGHYFAAWQSNKSLAVACSHTPAYAEAYMQTKEADFAQAVFAMNDWLVGLQYREEFDSSRKAWNGAFPNPHAAKQASVTPPDISSALAAESLAEACRVAKQAGDLARLQRYERALLASLRFLMSLQYTSANTQHFVEAFRPSLLGAFHASHQDGSLKIDYTQHALAAMVQYLDKVVD